MSKKSEYALIVLKHMGELPQGQKVSAREIEQHYHTPFDTTAKVMQLLCQHGLLLSTQGVKGGYGLACRLEEIDFYTFLDIMEETSGPDCLHTHKSCQQQSHCNVVFPLHQLTLRLQSFFRQLSLAEVLNFSSPSPIEARP